MKAVLRSVLPATAILLVAAAVAVAAVRWLPTGEEHGSRPSVGWTPPPGFEQIGTVSEEGQRTSLWVGRVGPPKPGDCWYLAFESAGVVNGAWGACGGVPGEPWLVRDGAVLAGGVTGAAFNPAPGVPAFLSIDGGAPFPLIRGHFVTLAHTFGLTRPSSMTVELLDRDRRSIGLFTEVPVSGDR